MVYFWTLVLRVVANERFAAGGRWAADISQRLSAGPCPGYTAVSNDLLLLSIEQNADSLAPLRQATPLFAAIACWEDVGTDPFNSLQAALPEYVRATAGPVGVAHTKPFCTGVGGHTYALTVFADGAVPAAQCEAAYRAFLPLGHRMSGLIRSLARRNARAAGPRRSLRGARR